jgi:hypothetical protein
MKIRKLEQIVRLSLFLKRNQETGVDCDTFPFLKRNQETGADCETLPFFRRYQETGADCETLPFVREIRKLEQIVRLSLFKEKSGNRSRL